MAAEDAAHKALQAKNAQEKNEIAQKMFGRDYQQLSTRQQDHISQMRIDDAFPKSLSPLEAAKRALERNPTDERARYLLAIEEQKAARQSRPIFEVIQGGKRAHGGPVYDDRIETAVRVARAFIDRYDPPSRAEGGSVNYDEPSWLQRNVTDPIYSLKQYIPEMRWDRIDRENEELRQKRNELRYRRLREYTTPLTDIPEPKRGLSEASSPSIEDTLNRLGWQYREMSDPIIGPDAEGKTKYFPASPFLRDPARYKPIGPTIKGF